MITPPLSVNKVALDSLALEVQTNMRYGVHPHEEDRTAENQDSVYVLDTISNSSVTIDSVRMPTVFLTALVMDSNVMHPVGLLSPTGLSSSRSDFCQLHAEV